MKCEIHFENGNILKFTNPDDVESLEGLINMVGNFQGRYEATSGIELYCTDSFRMKLEKAMERMK